MPFTLTTRYLSCQIAEDGRSTAFIDLTTGRDHLDPTEPAACAFITLNSKTLPAISANFDNGILYLGFGGGIGACIEVKSYESYLTWRVLAVDAPAATLADIDAFTFLDLALTPETALGEPFAACALALNLQTEVRELPQPASRLRAICYPRFGLAGAQAAIIGCPFAEMRSVMQQAVQAAPNLPHSPLGGPWGWDRPETRGSYMFNFYDLTEDTVDDWIAVAQEIGMNQIDFHGGRSFRFGDCYPSPELYPRGRASLQAVIDKLHRAGILAGLHTYAFFIDKRCSWVTPVPDRRLAQDAVLTLARPATADDTTIQVAESTAGMSAVTGFFVRNSATLRIDDELISYSAVSQEAPWVFSGCQRGAYGTRAASHAAGAQAAHLKECFGLFAPDGDSDLLAEVAAASAEMYNVCGFDMMYLDALDGEDVLGGADNGWHYGSKYVFELFSRLKKPPIMEMSTFHHHLWYVRSRIGAWDHPNRSHKRFIDLHCADNASCSRMYLPGHLGWWAVKTWTGPQDEPTFADDIEYLCGKAAGNRVGISVMGIEPSTIRTYPAYERLAKIIRRYEELRRSDYFTPGELARLKEPGAEFTLREVNGHWRLREAHYQRFKAELAPSQPQVEMVSNPYDRQACGLRIEALLNAAPYDSPERLTLLDLSAAEELGEIHTAPGIELAISSGEMRLTACNHTDSAQGSWAMVGRYLGALDLSGHEGLGVWVEGDGGGELLNVQLRSPEHITGAIADHYITIDFKGWRYFTLVEPEGERYSLYQWPYGTPYTIYRENIDFRQIESVSIWVNNVPAGGAASCRIKPIMALPLVAGALVNPAISAGGQTLVLPVEIASGTYLEYDGPDDCQLYGQKGELLARVQPLGSEPLLETGENTLELTSESPARARMTVSTRGRLVERI